MREAGVSAGKITSGTRRKQNERGFHSLRHTFISALAAADIPAELRMKLSGHSDLKRGQNYGAGYLFLSESKLWGRLPVTLDACGPGGRVPRRVDP